MVKEVASAIFPINPEGVGIKSTQLGWIDFRVL